MSSLRQFITFRKKKSTSEIAVNTDRQETLEIDANDSSSLDLVENPPQRISYPQRLETIEKRAIELKRSIEKRTTYLSRNKRLPTPDEVNIDLNVQEEDDNDIRYNFTNVRSYKIRGKRDLFQTNFELTGRFLPPSTKLLNQSVDQVNSAVTLDASSSFTEFCKQAINNSDFSTNIDESGRIFPWQSRFLNLSDNAVDLAINTAFKVPLRSTVDKAFDNFISLSRKLQGVSFRPKSKLVKRLKLATTKKLGRYSAEEQPTPVHHPLPSTTNFLAPESGDSEQSTCKDSEVSFKMDNDVIKFYSQLIPTLDITKKEGSALAIKTFMDRCRHACKALDDEQEKTFLFTIICRMSNDVVKRLKKYTFETLDDLEGALKDAYPQASNREYILEQIRSSRQRDHESIEDFIGRLRDLKEKGLSEDSEDKEYERASIIALKTGIKSDVVYVQMLQMGDTTFEAMANKAISADQDIRMRSRAIEVKPNSTDENLLEQFKRVLNVLESKTLNGSEEYSNNNLVRDASTFNLNALQQSSPAQWNNMPGRNSQNYQRVCYNCGKPGHFKNNCRLRRQNFGTQMPFYQNQHYPQNTGNHFIQDPAQGPPQFPVNAPSLNRRLGEVENCGLCGLRGHGPANCVRNQPSSSRSTDICQLCDAVGHTAKACPSIRQGNSVRSAQ